MNKKQKKNLTRVIISAVLLLIANILGEGAFALCFFFASYLVVGYDVIIKAVKNIMSMSLLDENFLMAIATVCAFIIKEYPEAAAIMLFYQIGELFQSIAVGKSRKSIKALMDICPEEATVIRDGKEEVVSPEEVEIDEIILIKPGEKIPLDAVVIEGESSVDTSALTGEAVPEDKKPGDLIISGTVNLNGVLKAKVKSYFEDSTVSKILELVETSTEKKSKSENFITRFAHVYTPAVVISALLIAVIPPLLFKGSLSQWLYSAIVFLVVSCPCALVISVPLSFFGGIGAASKKGILIKGSVYLENLSKVKTVMFDKTGTLTEGKFSVTEVKTFDYPEKEMVELAALCESMSLHPIALSVVAYSGIKNSDGRVKDLKEISGMGIEAICDGKSVLVGNEKLMEKKGIEYSHDKVGKTVVHVAVDGKYAGYIACDDKIKENTVPALKALKKAGVSDTVMLTGDNEESAKRTAESLHVARYFSRLLPNEKVEKAEEVINSSGKDHMTAFVGDGINDAPVLARADIGIAMGAMGSDAAIEASDIVLMDDDLRKIATAISISKKTMRIVHENIIFSLIVKLGVLLMGVLQIANIWFAVFADVGVMIIAVLNSMRALRIK